MLLDIDFEPPVRLSELLGQHCIEFEHPCGGQASCLKCRVGVSGSISKPTELEERIGARLSCQTVLLGDACCELNDEHAAMEIESSLKESYPASESLPFSYGAAIDVGTTSIVLALCRASDGAVVATASQPNPQRSVASDVMGRIDAALHGSSEHLRESVEIALSRLLSIACRKANVDPVQVESLVVVGNTAMLYLLFGQDPSCLSRAPFAADRLFGEELSLLGRRAYVPPCFGAFLGADLACAVLASGMAASLSSSLLCDIGTNGEVALWHEGILRIASAPAGPCFEGAGLSCGCSSVPGAVCGVWLDDNDKLQFETIANAEPVGLCGSGVIDIVAAGLRREDISEGGRIQDSEITLTDRVRITQEDLRSVQLAKAAIAAGIDVVMSEGKLHAEALEAFYVCGGFGSRLNLGNAAFIGLIPSELCPKAAQVGNAALEGAVMLLLDPGKRDIIKGLHDKARIVSLGGNALFEAKYIEHLAFDVE